MSCLEHIKDLIRKNGPLTVGRYMELALQHPEFGYYRKRDPLGKSGDFITAPEISQMFGEMLGLWCAEAWQQIGKPEQFVFLELGPGRGTLMQDALRATAKIKGFHEAMRLRLLESSEMLREAQQEKLAEYKPQYIGDMADLPALPLLAIANEFFDALPVRQFENTGAGWCERLITLEGEHLMFTLSRPDPACLLLIPEDRRDMSPGGVHEISMPALKCMQQLAQHIAQHGGAALIVDYGYAVPAGAGTLQAVSGHNYTDVLASPGEADLTAHVDFAALKHIAVAQGTQVLGPVGQGEFLQALGIEVRAMQLKYHATPEQAGEINSALQRLTDSAQMGNLFKVMAVAEPNVELAAGF